MTEPTTLFAVASAGIVGLALTSAAVLRGWNGWLELRRLELEGLRSYERSSAPGGNRIDLADLKERVWKLEAIASGVDL